MAFFNRESDISYFYRRTNHIELEYKEIEFYIELDFLKIEF